MPLISTKGGASAQGFGFVTGASGAPNFLWAVETQTTQPYAIKFDSQTLAVLGYVQITGLSSSQIYGQFGAETLTTDNTGALYFVAADTSSQTTWTLVKVTPSLQVYTSTLESGVNSLFPALSYGAGYVWIQKRSRLYRITPAATSTGSVTTMTLTAFSDYARHCTYISKFDGLVHGGNNTSANDQLYYATISGTTVTNRSTQTTLSSGILMGDFAPASNFECIPQQYNGDNYGRASISATAMGAISATNSANQYLYGGARFLANHPGGGAGCVFSYYAAGPSYVLGSDGAVTSSFTTGGLTLPSGVLNDGTVYSAANSINNIFYINCNWSAGYVSQGGNILAVRLVGGTPTLLAISTASGMPRTPAGPLFIQHSTTVANRQGL
jgi:hypothetical protein